MTNKFVFVADIDGDIDDIVAIEYLHRNGLLQCVVMDGQSRNSALEGYVTNLSARFSYDIPDNTKIIFCGGALTKVAQYLKEGHSLDYLIMNGGFAGSNIVPINQQLDKFKNKTQVRTYNFNLDVASAKYVLESDKVQQIVLISKNVCHSYLNTISYMHSTDKDWILNHYKLSETKRLHDLLMVQEGLNIIFNFPTKLKYERVDMTRSSEGNNNMVKWGSKLNPQSNIQISVGIL